MGSVPIVLVLGVAVCGVASSPQPQPRIVGGSQASIYDYPQMASLLSSYWGIFYDMHCGGTVLNGRSVLTTAHCVRDYSYYWRIRLGSTYANSGGTVYYVAARYMHMYYNPNTYDYDVAILRSRNTFTLGYSVQPAVIAGPHYELSDGQSLMAIGYGATLEGGSSSSTLQKTRILSVNQEECKKRYEAVGIGITDNMLCAGWLDVGGQAQCKEDDGSPLFHDNVVVGIYSKGRGCARPYYPSVNTRLSKFKYWIDQNS